jgi:3-deoxy-7-phosphoheptulonate synthase
MLESHLVAGAQKLVPGKQLTYGQSITDACMGWGETVELFEVLAGAVRSSRLS